MARSDVIAIQHWEELPRHIILLLFSHLPLNDRLSASLTCKLWCSCFQSPTLWRDFTFRFEAPEESPSNFVCIEKYGGKLRNIRFEINQRESLNCTNASRVITNFARCKERSLERLSLHFTKANPLFFQGFDILSSLAELFGPPDPTINFLSFLKILDLSEMSITLDDKLFYLLAGNHTHLEVLNMQNKPLTCRVTPECMENLVRKCRKLKKLVTFYKCISENVLFALMERDREPIQFLSLLCKMEEKYHRLISNEAWNKISSTVPSLRVAVMFDHTSDREQIRDILQPEIPLVELSMRSLTELHKEVDLAGKYFQDTLERFTVSTTHTDQLEHALINLAAKSKKLKSLHCICGLSKQTISNIMHLRPGLADYTLGESDLADDTLPPVFTGRFAQVQAMKEMGLFG